jgi:hypothetical protein
VKSYTESYTCKRPSTRVRISVRFRAQFAAKGLRGLILYQAPITTVCKHISEQIDPKLDSNPPLAPNRTPNRTPIRTQIRTCRRLLNGPLARNVYRVARVKKSKIERLASSIWADLTKKMRNLYFILNIPYLFVFFLLNHKSLASSRPATHLPERGIFHPEFKHTYHCSLVDFFQSNLFFFRLLFSLTFLSSSKIVCGGRDGFFPRVLFFFSLFHLDFLSFSLKYAQGQMLLLLLIVLILRHEFIHNYLQKTR